MGGQLQSATLQARMFQAADWTADRLGLFRGPLSADALIDTAIQRSGAGDFGEWSVHEPLAVLLQAWEHESHLSLFGRLAARWDCLRFLDNVLRFRREERRAPGILQQQIDAPVFVLGLPRSGTTFLHNLLALDPAHVAPRCWQTIFPYPAPGSDPRREPDARRRRVARQLAIFQKLAPEMRSLHPFDADSPQEFTEITAHVFRSRRFDMTHELPSYRRWLERIGHLDAYRFHRRFLQHLQHQGDRGRWVLKCPDHAFAFDALHAVYPDARFVFVHRDPARILPSVARLTEVVRRPFTRRMDRAAIGRQVSDDWVEGALALIAAAKSLHAAARVSHVYFAPLTRSPMETLRRVYAELELDWSAEAVRRMQQYVGSKPRGGYGRNLYRLEDYGVDPQVEERRFAPYMAYFGLEPESSETAR